MRSGVFLVLNRIILSASAAWLFSPGRLSAEGERVEIKRSSDFPASVTVKEAEGVNGGRFQQADVPFEEYVNGVLRAEVGTQVTSLVNDVEAGRPNARSILEAFVKSQAIAVISNFISTPLTNDSGKRWRENGKDFAIGTDAFMAYTVRRIPDQAVSILIEIIDAGTPAATPSALALFGRQVKRMEMEGKIHGNRTKVEMEVLKNEVNVALPEGVFEVK